VGCPDRDSHMRMNPLNVIHYVENNREGSTQAATAYLLTRRPVSSIIGLYPSYYLNIASGSAIVLTAPLFFVIAFLFNPRHGVLKRRINT
jgi:hypothetical protein